MNKKTKQLNTEPVETEGNINQIGKVGKKRGKKRTKIAYDEFQKIADEYLKERQEAGLPPFLTGLALKLNIDPVTLSRYGENAPYDKVIKKLKTISEKWLQDYILSSKTASINQMFLLKAVFGYRDNSTLDITTNGKPLGVVVLPKR